MSLKSYHGCPLPVYYIVVHAARPWLYYDITLFFLLSHETENLPLSLSHSVPFVFMGSSWLTRRPISNYLLHFFSILEKCPDNFGLNLGKPTNICLSFSHQTTRYEQKRLILYSIFITVEKINQPYCCGKDMKERGRNSSKSGKIVRF